MYINQKGFANIVLILIILAVMAVGGYFVFSKKLAPAPIITQPQRTNVQSNQQTLPPAGHTDVITKPSNFVPTAYDEKIAACYPKNEGCSACKPILNNSVHHVTETTRYFVNVPNDLYPKKISFYFTTVSGNATAGWISNGGLPGEGLNATPECWSTYYEFDGNGEVDLRVKSTKKGAPDYFVRFIVGQTQ